MKNKNYKVFVLTISCFLIYFLVSVAALLIDFKWQAFNNINLVSDIFHEQQEIEKDTLNPSLAKKDTATQVNSTPAIDFNLYHSPFLITNFKTQPTAPALLKFTQKLAALRKTKKGKIRIAYLGDSMIEGDLLTQELRKLLQNEFGGEGAGFVPIYSEIYGFRHTATGFGSDWVDTNFITNKSKEMFISGHVFTGEGKSSFRDNTLSNSNIEVEKSLLFGKTPESSILYNGSPISIKGENLANKIILAKDTRQSFTLQSKNQDLPLFGVTFETENGVFVDNFPFRSVTGSQLRQVSEEMLQAIHKSNPYDLIVFQYGVNLLFRPNDTNYDFYEEEMSPIFKKFKRAFPDSEFLILGSADRAFRYNGEFKTAIGLPNLIKIQATLAYNHHFAFYNLFESMGGENSIVKWAEQKPRLANRDHVHPNKEGTDILAKLLFDAMMKDYQLLNTSTLKEN